MEKRVGKDAPFSVWKRKVSTCGPLQAFPTGRDLSSTFLFGSLNSTWTDIYIYILLFIWYVDIIVCYTITLLYIFRFQMSSPMSLCMFHIITDLALKFEVQLDGRKNINRLARDVNVDAKRRRHMISHDVYSFRAGNAQPRALSASRPLRAICWLDDACCICIYFYDSTYRYILYLLCITC